MRKIGILKDEFDMLITIHSRSLKFYKRLKHPSGPGELERERELKNKNQFYTLY